MAEIKLTYKDFEICRPTFVGGKIPKEYENDWDIVLWQDHDPIEVTDGRTGEKRISTRGCMSVAFLRWDNKEGGYDFESCGLRWLEYGTEDAAKWIYAFAQFAEKALSLENEYG